MYLNNNNVIRIDIVNLFTNSYLLFLVEFVSFFMYTSYLNGKYHFVLYV